MGNKNEIADLISGETKRMVEKAGRTYTPIDLDEEDPKTDEERLLERIEGRKELIEQIEEGKRLNLIQLERDKKWSKG